MKRYSEYKDSGIEWLIDIPKEWSSKKLKFVTTRILDGTHVTPTYVDNGIPFLRVCDIQTKNIDFNTIKFISKEEHNKLTKRCNPEKGDVLLSKNGTIGITKVVNWDFPFSIFVSLCLLKFTKQINPYFFSYFFQSNVVNEQISNNSKQTSVINLHLDKIRELKIITPVLPEQEKIASFLDHKTALIDSLIAKKEKQIELLKEQRTALINHAVTKGLNPKAKMKDSGIEWLGEIPAHWEVKKLKYLSDNGLINGLFKKKVFFGRGTKLINVSDIYQNDLYINQEKLERVETTDTEKEKYKVCKGDIFFVRSSLKLEGVGKSAIIGTLFEDTVFECHIVKLTTNNNVLPELLIEILNSYIFVHLIISSAQTVTMSTIGQSIISNLDIPCPPIDKQKIIVNYITKEREKSNTEISMWLKQIELLKEYRTALISEAVTGKIDVRDWEPSNHKETI